jgi:adenylosuccinate synthase
MEHQHKRDHDYRQLPQVAREYLEFIARESGARIAMVSTGPGREETIFIDDFPR